MKSSSLLFISNMKLKHKLIYSFALLIFLSAFSIGTVSYYLLKRSIVSELGQSIQETLQQTMQNIDYKLRDIDEIYVKMIMNQKLQQLMEQPLRPGQADDAYKSFYEEIYPDVFGGRSEQLQSVAIYGENGLNLTYNLGENAMNRPIQEVRGTPLYKKASEGRGKPLWSFENQDLIPGAGGRSNTIVNVRKALGLLTFKDWGLVIISVRESYIYESYKDTLKKFHSTTFMVDEQGVIMSHPNKNRLSSLADPAVQTELGRGLNDSSLIKLEGINYSLHYVTSDHTGWKLVTLVPQSEMNQNLDLAKNTILLIIGLTVLLVFILSVVISTGITQPIVKLLRHIRKIKGGDMDTKLNLGTQEEFGELAESFNEMTGELKELITRAREDERRIRGAELRALQSQINPHMLYNSLDTIYWMTMTKDYEEIAEMTTSLAQFFRLVLNNGNERTSIAKEVETIEQYLRIQILQFKDKIRYEILIEKELLEMSCIKLILQPLVENAILHGIKPLRSGQGHISITGQRQGGDILLEVADNGVGMDAARKKSLLEPPVQGTGGYGAYNVHERIMMAYGPGYGIEYESEPGLGTRVRLLIPGGEYV
ncbi:sensor histidine kinase [Paenibacillus nasutitermitis]|uniref:histidine kinase n=1 Tax=Paenibacillus nasutitermitis TaxID=1652958 RepID=A0A917DPH7_9BACL|nr:sensor histidine kinase [Paenibacillus nasutitermitis]GGD54044.1 sensor histidine kinase YesM [Paenibacillus nasutitermitis]